MNQIRTIRVYIPPNYSASTRRIPVLYMHDGQNIFRDEDAIGDVSLSLEKILDDRLCQMLVVGIDCIPEQRVEDYCPWQAGEFSQQFQLNKDSWQANGQRYLDFITNELKPFIDQYYRTDAERTAMAGISLGGLISAYAACSYPAIYQKIAMFSSSFYRNQEKLEQYIRMTDLSPLTKVHMDCGDLEANNNDEINKTFMTSNERVAQLLQTKLTIVDGGKHDYHHFKRRVPTVLMNLFSEGK